MTAYLEGQGSEQAALEALAASRFLVPVIAVLADGFDAGRAYDKNSEMVISKLIGRDGRPAVLAFTGLDALARWRPDARPVPAEADRVWRAAVADGLRGGHRRGRAGAARGGGRPAPGARWPPAAGPARARGPGRARRSRGGRGR